MNLKIKVAKALQKYFFGTSVHGLRYIEVAKSKGRKIAWILLSSSMLVLCFVLVYAHISRFNHNFTQTNLATNSYPVWENPFPGVSICNYNIVQKRQVGTIFEKLIALGFPEEKIWKFLGHLNRLIICNNCNNSITRDFDLKTYDEIHKALNENGYTMDRMMIELSQPCESMLKECSWKSISRPCMEIFKFVKTSNGFCCTFNYFGSTEVQVLGEKEEDYRYYTGGAGIHFGLTVLLDPEVEEYISSIRPLPGFDVLVRNSNDFANMRLISKSLLSGQTLSIGLYVSATVSDSDVVYLDPIKRGCQFENEASELKTSKLYTFHNCLSECRMFSIFNLCNCIPYFFPVDHNQYRVCTLVDVPCIRKNELTFSSMVVMSEVDEGTISKIDKRHGNATKCRCLPDCDETKYDMSIDRSLLQNSDGSSTNYSVLNVFFNSIGATMSTRSVSVPWDIFLASIGGVFGLCLGASVISLLEIIFHFGEALTKKQEKIVN